MPSYFPIFINMEQKKCHVFGAGNIALRRIRTLLRYKAQVKVTALFICEEVRELQKDYPKQLHIEQRAYCMGELQGVETDFVLAATDNREVNACISLECRQNQIPVSNASDSSQCTFYFPAVAQLDNLVIGITSLDGNHRDVAAFRKKLCQQYQEERSAERNGTD